MKVASVSPVRGERVEFLSNWTVYYRYGPDCWFMSIGESDEPLYHCEEHEAAYQEWKKQNETN